MLRLNAVRCTAVACCALSARPSAAETAGVDIGGEVQAGRVFVRSYTPAEANKVGPAAAATLFLRRAFWRGAWQLGVGMQRSDVDGSASTIGIAAQRLRASTAAVEGRYLFALPQNFALGVSLRGFYGQGASFDVQKTATSTYAFAAGPVASYSRNCGVWNLAATASYGAYTGAATIREVAVVLFGVAVSYHFGAEALVGPPASPPAPAS